MDPDEVVEVPDDLAISLPLERVFSEARIGMTRDHEHLDTPPWLRSEWTGWSPGFKPVFSA
jgi:hypothetical protein